MNTRSQDRLTAPALSPPAPEHVAEAVDRSSGLAWAPPDPLIRSELAGSDGQAVAAAGLPKIVKFAALARCGDEIWIENEGQIYRLRKTRQGKLILTK
ncbi:MAG: hemin uptake protein HemP [Planctomycetaceae bacterium]